MIILLSTAIQNQIKLSSIALIPQNPQEGEVRLRNPTGRVANSPSYFYPANHMYLP